MSNTSGTRRGLCLVVLLVTCIDWGLDSTPARTQVSAVCGAGTSESWIAACGAIIDNPRESLQNRVRALKFRGLAHYRDGDVGQAAADFSAATALAPDDPEAWINLGMMRQTRGDLDGAVADYDKALALDPQSWVAHVNRGNALRLKADPGGAIAEYDVALALKPDLGAALRGRGVARAMRGDLTGAIADATAALRIDPRDGEALLDRGNVLRRLGYADKALTDYDGATRAAPENPSTWLDRGALLLEKGDVAAAIASFDKTIALDPTNVQAYNNRGAAESQNGDFVRATTDLDRAVRLAPSSEEAHGNRGFVRLAVGDFAGAAEDFGVLLAREPDDPYRILWRQLARMRAGLTEAGLAEEDFARQAAALGTGTWPGPLLALYAGSLDRARVMAMETEVDPAQRSERGCEIRFYVGEYALAKDDREGAAPLLREAATLCPVGFLERAGAIGELNHLRP